MHSKWDINRGRLHRSGRRFERVFSHAARNIVDVIAPTTQRLAPFVEVQGAIVNSRDAALRRTTYVVDHCLHDVRGDAELLIHDGDRRPAEIVQRPWLKRSEAPSLASAIDCFVEQALSFAKPGDWAVCCR